MPGRGEASRGAGLRRAATLLGAAALLAGAACGLASCAKKAAPKPPEFAFPADAPAAFVLGPDGLRAVARGETVAEGEAQPSPLALRVACLASDASGSMLVAAENRFGLNLLLPSPDGKAYKVLNRPLAETASQSAFGLWPRGDGFLLELYRDPFVDGAAKRSDEAPELLLVSRDGKATTLSRLGDPGEDLFSLVPAPGGTWFAELRSEQALGARLRYRAYATPENRGSGKEVSRDDFEASLAPKPLSLAPASLRAAASLVAASGQVLVHARTAAGAEAYWLSGGAPELATELLAWVGPEEEASVAISRDGHGAVAKGGDAQAFLLAAPAAGATFSSVSALFGQGIVAASWETGSFPDVSASGLCVAPLPKTR